MTYIAGSSILAADYNTFVQGGAGGVNHAVANVNSIWGVGSGDKGYGQTGTLATVSPGGSILASQWTALTSRVSTILQHQTGGAYTISNGPAIVPGAIITAVTNLPTTISSIYTNRMDLYSGYSYDETFTQHGSLSWTTYYRHTLTCAFQETTYDKVRYFWNTGGAIKLQFTNSSSSGDGATWDTLATQCGEVWFKGNSTSQVGWGGGNAATIASSTGFYQLTGSDQQIFRQDSTDVVKGYYIKVNARMDPPYYVDPNTGVLFNLVLTVEYRDPYPAPVTRSGYPETLVAVVRPNNGHGLSYLPTISWEIPDVSGAYAKV